MLEIFEIATESPSDTFERGRNWTDSILPGGDSGSQDNTTPSNEGGDLGDSAREFGIGIGTVVFLVALLALAFGQLFDIDL